MSCWSGVRGDGWVGAGSSCPEASPAAAGQGALHAVGQCAHAAVPGVLGECVRLCCGSSSPLGCLLLSPLSFLSEHSRPKPSPAIGPVAQASFEARALARSRASGTGQQESAAPLHVQWDLTERLGGVQGCAICAQCVGLGNQPGISTWCWCLLPMAGHIGGRGLRGVVGLVLAAAAGVACSCWPGGAVAA